ncbi:ABC transporter permease [Fodinibius sediminis]|uniref:ABC-type transport system, involved in lipoprotein release, permease component n=1 Tax=Fodinibius sediminis TaxID=1214077 RepID=A0A521BXF1_9BACT|nr:FtsX-like permease family protein [Fodinibius sediminis]SMO51863.1 ABC-type transport system, involved in lipoprotein release, permease component [Fodinibius sediminis]
MLSLKLAWRNIWRSKRRTLITIASITIAVLLSAVMRSMQEGQYKDMIDTTVGTFSGYIQVHASGYWEEQTLENSFIRTDSLLTQLNAPEGVSAVVPRIESFALGAGSRQSRPVMVLGIDVDAERQLMNPEKRLESGHYFKRNDERAAIVGREVLDRLQLQRGDSLVLLGQGFRGMSATGLYPVKGTFSLPNPEMNKSLVLLPLSTAQDFLAAGDRLTSAALVVSDPDRTADIVQELRERLPGEAYEVLPWQELMPGLVQGIEVDRVSGYIILGVLYMVVGFGILGTLLMMISERTYELGIMLSVGTPRRRLASILSIEILIVTMIGSITGILMSLPISWYFNAYPIELTGDMAATMENYGLQPMIQFSVDASIFLSQALIIFVITLLFSFIPIIRASRLNPVKAMRS